MTKRTRYTEEFKRQAVELLENRDKSATDLARELGVRQNQLYKWREQLLQKGGAAFKGAGRQINRCQSTIVSNIREHCALAPSTFNNLQ